MKNSNFKLLLIICLFLSNFMVLTALVSAKQVFPDSIEDVSYLKYSFTQEFSHFDGKRRDDTSGIIEINIQKTSLEMLNFSVYHDIDIWKCSTGSIPDVFNANFNYIVDPYSREIESVLFATDGYGGTDLEGNYVYYFIDTSIEIGDYINLLHDDMVIFAGTPFFSSPYFRFENYEDIIIGGNTYESIHITYESTLGYNPSIEKFVCGLGWNPLINSSVDLYYEKRSGVLLYAISEYTQYISPDEWQTHNIERKILDINFVDEPSNSDLYPNPSGDAFNPFNTTFWQDESNIIGISAIMGIIISTLAIMLVLRNRSIKWKLDAIRGIDNIEEKLKQEIKDLKEELGLDED